MDLGEGDRVARGLQRLAVVGLCPRRLTVIPPVFAEFLVLGSIASILRATRR